MMGIPTTLTILVFSPIVLGFLLGLIPKDKFHWAPWVACIISLGVFVYSLGFFFLLVVFNSVNYFQSSHRLYYFLFLALETDMLGTFVAQDIFLFYIFWEIMLFPMLLIIGIWGGSRRIYASIKFFLYTLVGSLLMLVGIFVLLGIHKSQMGYYSTHFSDLYELVIPGGTSYFDLQSLLFLSFILAFSIKVPLFPFHTWLPDAHVEAPTGGSVILAGVLLKMGIYAMLRLAFPLFPQATVFYAPLMIGLGIAGVIYGACVAMVQPDIKKLVAYSSVSHLGFCVIGIFALNQQGLSGGVYQMLSHGITTSALFTIVGFLYERYHTREIAKFGGLSKVTPYLVVAFMIVTLGSIGLPTTSGFIGEFLVLFGAFKYQWVTALLAGIGVILGAIYMLWMFRRVCFGTVRQTETAPSDLSLREWLVITPYIVMVFVMGMASPFFLKYIEPSLKVLMKTMDVAGVE